MRNVLLLLFLSALTATAASGQTQQSGWVASVNTFKINDQFSFYFDAQARSTDNLRDVQSLILRPGINYHINPHLFVTAGYAFIPSRRVVGEAAGLLAEHRIWLQGQYNHAAKRVAVSHRLRFEQRFIPTAVARGRDVESDGFRDARRLRYSIRNILPLVKERPFNKGFFLSLQDEVFANVGDKSAVNGRVFDQNRLLLGVGYRLPNKLDFEVGYLNQYVKNRTSTLTNHVIQFTMFRRL